MYCIDVVRGELVTRAEQFMKFEQAFLRYASGQTNRHRAGFKGGGKLGSCPGSPQLRGLHKKQ